jgi:hypothetical protein
MKKKDVVFFEFASDLLAMTAYHLPKTCPIVTRLHRYEMYKWVDLINWEAVDKIILVSHAKKKEFVNRFPNLADLKKRRLINVSVCLLTSLDLLNRESSLGDHIGILMSLYIPRKRMYMNLILHLYRDLLNDKGSHYHLHIGGAEPAWFE